MSKQKSQTVMYGAFILMISNILVKLIGALFKIPLTNLIGSEGMAYFNAAYSIYVSFYMISTAGIPVAISRMIATSNVKKNVREINKTFKIAFWVFFAIGVTGTAVMILLAKKFAGWSKLDNSFYAMIGIAPTLFFICLSSAYRGYFQGLQNMIPTAVSQVIESLGKLLIGLLAGWYFISRGYEIHIVAAYVISGVTIGVAFSLLYIMIVKSFSAKDFTIDPAMPTRTTKDLLYELVIISIPISIASSIMGLTNVVDTMLVTKRMVESGADIAVATKSYGAYTSMAVTLFNMPTNLIYPFAISVLPALSALYSENNMEKAKSLMNSTFRVASIIAVPCALGLSGMSKPILTLLYKKEIIEQIGSTTIDVAAPCLRILAISVFFVGMIAVTNSMLQAMHLQNKTIISTSAGIIVKIISAYILLGIPSVGVLGAAVSTTLCYFTIMMSNMIFLLKNIKYFPNILSTFLKPIISGFACIAVCIFAYSRMCSFLPQKISTLAGIVIAAVVYVAVLFLVKGVSKEDIIMLPKGDKICKMLERAHLL